MKKRCVRCKEEKDTSGKMFMPDSRYRDGMHPHCRSCRCEIARHGRIKKVFGLSPSEYKAIMEASDCCAVCGSQSNLGLDHNHTTGALREVLCSNCNTCLGLAGDNVLRLKDLIIYLEKHAALAYS